MALFSGKKNTGEKAKAPAQKAAAKKSVKAAKEAASFTNPEGRYERMLGKPRITEKATLAIGGGAYVFEVPQDATKPEITKAVQALYKVTPKKVNVVRIAPRKTVSRMRGRRGVSPGIKKAYVYLQKGERIELI